MAGATVQAGNWTLGAPSVVVDGAMAASLARSLNRGTSIDVQASNGDVSVRGNVQWSGSASLSLDASRSVNIVPRTIVANTGSGSLTVRADANGVGNGGGIVNQGTVDWTKSTGIVSLLYDMNGAYSAGALLGIAMKRAAIQRTDDADHRL